MTKLSKAVAAALLLGCHAAVSSDNTCASHGGASCVQRDHNLLQFSSQAEKSSLLDRKATRGTSSGPSNADLQEVFDRHNLYRCMHGADPMVWNDVIAANAQAWATQSGGQLAHSSSQSRQNKAGFWALGENLAKGVTNGRAVDMFYDEIRDTPGGTGAVTSFTAATGHYTQVVWADSKDLGCAINGDLLVCQYGPAGNVGGQFTSQVNTVSKSRSQCEASNPSPSPSPSPTPTPTPSPSPSGCQDSTSFSDQQWGGRCTDWAIWVPQGYRCENFPDIVDELHQNCPNACGSACPGAPTTTTTTTTTTTPTTQATTRAPGDCSDDHAYMDPEFGGSCRQWEEWVGAGWPCQDYPQIYAELGSKCPAACGLCEPNTGCTDDAFYRDTQWGGTCLDWQSWHAAGFKCESYPRIRDNLLSKCPSACGVCS